ncbi:unnamed protein product [Closterium sp. NIES-65]|nr:unnamed protein product [Closterium sp. NIES-65]
MRIATVTPARSLQNRFEVFRHSEWVGQSLGLRVRAAKGGGFLHLLSPSPTLWTKILYLPDIALIIALIITRLAVTPGVTVLESGTGTGSLLHSLTHAVAPTGRLFSFDFHHGCAEQARAELEASGIVGVSIVVVRDIQGDGFPPHLHATTHAIFLDLPCPWRALPSAASCLIAGGPARGGGNERASEGEGGQRSDGRAAKRRREEGGGGEEGGMEQITATRAEGGREDGDARREAGAAGRGRREAGRRQRGVAESVGEERGYVAARPVADSKGHTGYLTFATKPV